MVDDDAAALSGAGIALSVSAESEEFEGALPSELTEESPFIGGDDGRVELSEALPLSGSTGPIAYCAASFTISLSRDIGLSRLSCEALCDPFTTVWEEREGDRPFPGNQFLISSTAVPFFAEVPLASVGGAESVRGNPISGVSSLTISLRGVPSRVIDLLG